MRYPRHAVTGAASDEQEMPHEATEDGAVDAPSDDETQALAA